VIQAVMCFVCRAVCDSNFTAHILYVE